MAASVPTPVQRHQRRIARSPTRWAA